MDRKVGDEEEVSLYDDLENAVGNLEKYIGEMVKEGLTNQKVFLEFGKISLASIAIVQNSFHSDASRLLRMRILELGRRCVRLMTDIGDKQSTPQDSSWKSALQNGEKDVINAVALVREALSYQREASSTQDIYGKCIHVIRNDSLKCLEPTDGGVDQSELLRRILQETQALYSIVKMVVVNLVASRQEKLFSLSLLADSFLILLRALRQYSFKAPDVQETTQLQNLATSLSSKMPQMLSACHKADTSKMANEDKETLKVALKDLLHAIGQTAEIVARLIA